MPGGVEAEAQSAATRNNAQNLPFQEKTTLSNVLADAREKILGDRAVTKEHPKGTGDSKYHACTRFMVTDDEDVEEVGGNSGMRR